MRILITGSSGQIGTNLALRLQRDGHEVFGVDKRPNAWVGDAFPTLLQDLAGHYSAFPGGINGVEYPEVDLVVHIAAHAKVHQLVRQPHRALENAIMTFNVLEYARGIEPADRVLVEPRGLRRRASVRGVRGKGRRLRLYREPYSASKIASEAFIYSYARCYGLRYLVFRFSNVYGRYDNYLRRMDRVLPLWIHQLSRNEAITVYGETKMLDFTYVDDCVDGITRGIYGARGGPPRQRDDQPRLRQGQPLVRAAEMIATELGVDPEITIAPPLLGEVTHYVANVTKAHDLLG